MQERSNIYYMTSGSGVCVENCPLETNYTAFICFDEIATEIVDNVTGEVSGCHFHLHRSMLPEGISCRRSVSFGTRQAYIGLNIFSFSIGERSVNGSNRGLTVSSFQDVSSLFWLSFSVEKRSAKGPKPLYACPSTNGAIKKSHLRGGNLRAP